MVPQVLPGKHRKGFQRQRKGKGFLYQFTLPQLRQDEDTWHHLPGQAPCTSPCKEHNRVQEMSCLLGLCFPLSTLTSLKGIGRVHAAVAGCKIYKTLILSGLRCYF